MIGQTKNGGDCKRNEILYVIECKKCKDQYYGETARNGHTRGIEHLEDSESQNQEKREKSVLLRHMQEKHDGTKVEFEMKVLKSYQHDPLARQCAEAVWIKNSNPEKRINNKKEFHQPGDVELIYKKNENEEVQKKIMAKKEARNKRVIEENRKINTEEIKVTKTKTIEPSIIDFIKKVRFDRDTQKVIDVLEKENNESENNESETISTQEMIEDARERRRNNKNTFACKQCDYKSPSTTLLKKYIKSVHEEIQFHCAQCNYKAATKSNLIGHEKTVHEIAKFYCYQCNYTATTKTNLTEHVESNHKNMMNREVVNNTDITTKNTYISKRIKCKICVKKFNKEETYLKHMKQDHKENSIRGNNGVQKTIPESMMTFQRTLRSDKTIGRAPVPIN